MERDERSDREQVTISSLRNRMKIMVNSRMNELVGAEDLLLLMTIIEMLDKMEKK